MLRVFVPAMLPTSLTPVPGPSGLHDHTPLEPQTGDRPCPPGREPGRRGCHKQQSSKKTSSSHTSLWTSSPYPSLPPFPPFLVLGFHPVGKAEGEQGTDGKVPNQPPEQEAASSQSWERWEHRLTLETHRGVWGPRWLLDSMTFNVTLEK